MWEEVQEIEFAQREVRHLRYWALYIINCMKVIILDTSPSVALITTEVLER